jgi:hypothetical protein
MSNNFEQAECYFLYLTKIGGNLWMPPHNNIVVLYEKVPQVLEVVGLGFTIWFTSRYLIFKVSVLLCYRYLCPFYGPSSDIRVVFGAGES